MVSDKLSILINLSGLVDVEAELARLRGDVSRLNMQLETYRRKVTAPGYEEKVFFSVCSSVCR